ncbi:MAG: hypothetical protein U0R79_10660 [Propionicimonas sp.]
MDRIGWDVVLAVVVAAWFAVTGLVELFSPTPAAGRRAADAEPGWVRVGRRVRGALEVIGAAAVAAGAVIGALGLRVPFPGRAVGLGLAALALWGAAESVRPPSRWVRVLLAALGFALAVFYAGFRE